MTEMYDLVGRVLADPNLAAQLSATPVEALRAAGIETTPEMLGALQGLDADSVRELASAFLAKRGFTG